jgi:hypothetical protein
MQRRELITALGEAAAGPVARTQRAMPVIEFFNAVWPNSSAATSLAFPADPRDPRRNKKVSGDVRAAAVPLGLRLHVLCTGSNAPREPQVSS